jgi:hypothetical protein
MATAFGAEVVRIGLASSRGSSSRRRPRCSSRSRDWQVVVSVADGAEWIEAGRFDPTKELMASDTFVVKEHKQDESWTLEAQSALLGGRAIPRRPGRRPRHTARFGTPRPAARRQHRRRHLREPPTRRAFVVQEMPNYFRLVASLSTERWSCAATRSAGLRLFKADLSRPWRAPGDGSEALDLAPSGRRAHTIM